MNETDAIIVNRLTAWVLNAPVTTVADGVGWYGTAKAICDALAVAYGVTEDYTYRAMACLSAQTRWDRNVELVSLLLQGCDKPSDVPADRWARAKSGLLREDGKVWNFYLSIRSAGMEGCCIDTHMIRAILGSDYNVRLQGLTFKAKSPHYRRFAAILQEVALETGFTNPQTQAIIWILQRGKAQ